jgi:hypothetical protein
VGSATQAKPARGAGAGGAQWVTHMFLRGHKVNGSKVGPAANNLRRNRDAPPAQAASPASAVQPTAHVPSCKGPAANPPPGPAFSGRAAPRGEWI